MGARPGYCWLSLLHFREPFLLLYWGWEYRTTMLWYRSGLGHLLQCISIVSCHVLEDLSTNR